MMAGQGGNVEPGLWTSTISGDGGYEDGYRACPCFWGDMPGSLVARLVQEVRPSVRGRALDLGAGEGKNASYLAGAGYEVLAVELSEKAIRNGRRHFRDLARLTWHHGDALSMRFPDHSFDFVVMYGLLHCLASREQVCRLVQHLQRATNPGGWHALVAFNNRSQDLTAHPGFVPLLLPHSFYQALYAGWRFDTVSDTDLCETHPHNGIPHTHSMTRILAQRVHRA